MCILLTTQYCTCGLVLFVHFYYLSIELSHQNYSRLVNVWLLIACTEQFYKTFVRIFPVKINRDPELEWQRRPTGRIKNFHNSKTNFLDVE